MIVPLSRKCEFSSISEHNEQKYREMIENVKHRVDNVLVPNKLIEVKAKAKAENRLQEEKLIEKENEIFAKHLESVRGKYSVQDQINFFNCQLRSIADLERKKDKLRLRELEALEKENAKFQQRLSEIETCYKREDFAKQLKHLYRNFDRKQKLKQISSEMEKKRLEVDNSKIAERLLSIRGNYAKEGLEKHYMFMCQKREFMHRQFNLRKELEKRHLEHSNVKFAKNLQACMEHYRIPWRVTSYDLICQSALERKRKKLKRNREFDQKMIETLNDDLSKRILDTKTFYPRDKLFEDYLSNKAKATINARFPDHGVLQTFKRFKLNKQKNTQIELKKRRESQERQLLRVIIGSKSASIRSKDIASHVGFHQSQAGCKTSLSAHSGVSATISTKINETNNAEHFFRFQQNINDNFADKSITTHKNMSGINTSKLPDLRYNGDCNAGSNIVRDDDSTTADYDSDFCDDSEVECVKGIYVKSLTDDGNSDNIHVRIDLGKLDYEMEDSEVSSKCQADRSIQVDSDSYTDIDQSRTMFQESDGYVIEHNRDVGESLIDSSGCSNHETSDSIKIEYSNFVSERLVEKMENDIKGSNTAENLRNDTNQNTKNDEHSINMELNALRYQSNISKCRIITLDTGISQEGNTSVTAKIIEGNVDHTSDYSYINNSIIECSNSGVVETGNSSVVESGNSGVVKTGNNGVVETSNSGVIESGNSAVLQTGNSGVVETGNSGIVETSNSGVVETGNSGAVETSNSAALQTGNSGVVETGNSGVVESGNSDVVETGNSGVVETGNSGVVESGNSGVVETGNSGVVESGNSGVVETGNSGVVESVYTGREETGNSGVEFRNSGEIDCTRGGGIACSSTGGGIECTSDGGIDYTGGDGIDCTSGGDIGYTIGGGIECSSSGGGIECSSVGGGIECTSEGGIECSGTGGIECTRGGGIECSSSGCKSGNDVGVESNQTYSVQWYHDDISTHSINDRSGRSHQNSNYASEECKSNKHEEQEKLSAQEKPNELNIILKYKRYVSEAIMKYRANVASRCRSLSRPFDINRLGEFDAIITSYTDLVAGDISRERCDSGHHANHSCDRAIWPTSDLTNVPSDIVDSPYNEPIASNEIVGSANDIRKVLDELVTRFS